MAQLKNLLGSGIPGGQAEAIMGRCGTGLTATGSTQTDALLLPHSINEFTTVASSTGARIPSGLVAGDVIVVYNGGAQTLTVYPPTGESITNGATNAGFSVGTIKTAYFVKRSNTAWAVVLSA